MGAVCGSCVGLYVGELCGAVGGSCVGEGLHKGAVWGGGVVHGDLWGELCGGLWPNIVG